MSAADRQAYDLKQAIASVTVQEQKAEIAAGYTPPKQASQSAADAALDAAMAVVKQDEAQAAAAQTAASA